MTLGDEAEAGLRLPRDLVEHSSAAGPTAAWIVANPIARYEVARRRKQSLGIRAGMRFSPVARLAGRSSKSPGCLWARAAADSRAFRGLAGPQRQRRSHTSQGA